MHQRAPSVLLLDHALKIALGIACDLTRAETLEGIALAYAEAGQVARAATILRRIWQMARGLPKPTDRVWQLRWLAEACVEANLEELALARGCAAGNEKAWEVFLTRYRATLYEAARGIVREESRAKELADSLYADAVASDQ